jgi:uncharacterized protein YndB with AHSA1/START domain
VGILDQVRRVLEIRAPRERVWAALSRPDELVPRFPSKRAEIDLAKELDELRAYLEAA